MVGKYRIHNTFTGDGLPAWSVLATYRTFDTRDEAIRYATEWRGAGNLRPDLILSVRKDGIDVWRERVDIGDNGDQWAHTTCAREDEGDGNFTTTTRI